MHGCAARACVFSQREWKTKHMSHSTPAAAATDADLLNRRAPRHSIERVYKSGQSFAFRARQRRFAHVRAMIDEIIAKKGHCRIADMGGTAYYWDIARPFVARAPVEIHLFNLDLDAPDAGAPFVAHHGNVCDLNNIDDMSFDLVHSNSVIEHVGTWREMSQMATNVRRLAPAYYVQTPYYWFPIEPHFRALGFHYLPEQIRLRLMMNFNLGFGGRRDTVDAAMQAVQSAVLLDRRQFAALFPDATIVNERFGPLTKSLMAIRRPRSNN